MLGLLRYLLLGAFVIFLFLLMQLLRRARD